MIVDVVWGRKVYKDGAVRRPGNGRGTNVQYRSIDSMVARLVLVEYNDWFKKYIPSFFYVCPL